MLFNYIKNLRAGKIALWCYLIWYLITVFNYFDTNLKLWVNSLGISIVIGLALMLSVADDKNGFKLNWQTARLFIMPFCVSSFSALIKDQSYFIIIPTNKFVLLQSIVACAVFIAVVFIIKRTSK
jgi:hypothetical protein